MALPYVRADADAIPLPSSAPVPILKVSNITAEGRAQDGPLITPRSMMAAERAHAEREEAALSAERAAATAKFRAEEAAAESQATPRSTTLAAEAQQAAAAAAVASERAAITEGAVSASVGTFALVSERGWGRFVNDRYATEADARTVADTLWGSWIVYHEQRGAYTEVASGGLFFRHGAIRKYVATVMRRAFDQAIGSPFGAPYATNY